MDNATPSNADKLARLREIIRAVDICMLTTVGDDGSLHSRPMSNNRDVEFDGNLWFFTYGSSLKADEVGKVPQVCASFADNDSHCYVSLTGSATIVRDRAKLAELWKPVYKAWFPGGLDTPDIALLHVEAERGEYWDGSQGGFIAQAIGMISALVSGKEASYGENERVEL
jgi:general stress protein 26